MGPLTQLAGVEINAPERNLSIFGKIEGASLPLQVTPKFYF